MKLFETDINKFWMEGTSGEASMTEECTIFTLLFKLKTYTNSDDYLTWNPSPRIDPEAQNFITGNRK